MRNETDQWTWCISTTRGCLGDDVLSYFTRRGPPSACQWCQKNSKAREKLVTGTSHLADMIALHPDTAKGVLTGPGPQVLLLIWRDNLKISSVFMHRTFASVFSTLNLYPNSPCCNSVFSFWRVKGCCSPIPVVLSPGWGVRGAFLTSYSQTPSRVTLAQRRETWLTQKQGQLELGIREPLARGQPRTQSSAGEEQGSAEQNRVGKSPGLRSFRDQGLNSGSAISCVILHKLLNLSEPHTFTDKMRTCPWGCWGNERTSWLWCTQHGAWYW